jgi:hypothetical protein
VPAGTNLVTVDSSATNPPNASLPSDNTGWVWAGSDGAIYVESNNAVVDGVKTTGIEDMTTAAVTVKNSEIDGVISSNGNNGLITLQDDTINGGSQASTPTVGVPNVKVIGSNIQGGKDEVNCEGNNCTVEDSYLNNQYTGDSSAHQQAFFQEGGTGVLLDHDTLGCIGPDGQCTADVSILGTTSTDDVTVENNLLLAQGNQTAYCLYPGADASPVGKWGPWENITITGNVFQKGPNGECGNWGPVYGWYPSQCESTAGAAPPSTPADTSCSFSGNTYDNGTAINESFQ